MDKSNTENYRVPALGICGYKCAAKSCSVIVLL